MSYLDSKYARLAGAYLNKFKETRNNHFNFRCPKCGDSKTDPEKSRGWFYLKDRTLKFKCHNCGYTKASLLKFLQEFIPNLYTDYLLELNGPRRPSQTTDPKRVYSIEKANRIKSLSHSITPGRLFKKLDEESKEYLKNRKVPEIFWSRIYCTDRFKTITNNLIKDKFSNNEEYGRKFIIFPLISKDQNFIGYQGRCITSTKGPKYITIAFHKNRYQTIFGADRVSCKKRVWIFEGPIDSLFIENSIALCGASKSIDFEEYPNRVFVLDPDTRNPQIVKMYNQLITKGERIVILPKRYSGMDTNDLVLQGIDPLKLYKQHSYSGLMAKVEIAKWKSY